MTRTMRGMSGLSYRAIKHGRAAAAAVSATVVCHHAPGTPVVASARTAQHTASKSLEAACTPRAMPLQLLHGFQPRWHHTDGETSARSALDHATRDARGHAHHGGVLTILVTLFGLVGIIATPRDAHGRTRTQLQYRQLPARTHSACNSACRSCHCHPVTPHILMVMPQHAIACFLPAHTLS